jgi:Flp pilus assembly protein TadD
VDRGFDWFLSLTEWQTGRGLIAQALFTLTPLLAPERRQALNPQNRMRLCMLVAQCLAGLGQLEPATGELRQAVTLGRELAAADPTNASWQRDLSVSYNKLGDVQLAQGNLAGAQASFEESRQIRARLAAADPTNAEWQADLVVSLVRVSAAVDSATPAGRETARSALRHALGIAEKLVAEGRLTSHKQQGWVEDLRRRLAALE